ncbi:putative signal peptide protein [Rhodopirellula islandica]|uniref:Signal peptide protein n=1 Tax=Rhodopirellula islandica TaxID=595434 RepID=A0A0J1BAS2_RHOIS|nr:hypothetical protein [Rhodopirellula islandica]KLU03628.1 putative signal peptide protein [Rhodopirellula islandica]
MKHLLVSFIVVIAALFVPNAGEAGGPPKQGRTVAPEIVAGLPRFDRAEVYSLKQKPGFAALHKQPAPDRFPVRPYDAFAEIGDRTTLDNEQSEQFVKTWERLNFERYAGAMCHYPVYGLRFYNGDELVFETTICWKCRNFYFYDEADEKYRWHGFQPNEASKSLLAYLRSVLPHPDLPENG